MYISEIIEKANQELGVMEVPANSNNVKYNTWFYGNNVHGSKYPWCMAFISWLFRSEQTLCKKTASCIDALSWFEKNGQVVTKPMPGDLAFFKFSTNNRRTNHVGLVVAVQGNTVYTVEGNTSVTSDDNGGKVMKRIRSKNIVAFARPKYKDAYFEVKKEKTKDEIVDEVIKGLWGNGEIRKNKLTEAGYNYDEIRELVNKKLKG